MAEFLEPSCSLNRSHTFLSRGLWAIVCFPLVKMLCKCYYSALINFAFFQFDFLFVALSNLSSSHQYILPLFNLILHLIFFLTSPWFNLHNYIANFWSMKIIPCISLSLRVSGRVDGTQKWLRSDTLVHFTNAWMNELHKWIRRNGNSLTVKIYKIVSKQHVNLINTKPHIIFPSTSKLEE